MDALVALPGVGRKTANVVLGHALGVPGLPVDRHVLRVANRIGIAESDDPVVVEQQLCGALPPERWTRTSDTLILHGRRICKPEAALRPMRGARTTCDFFRIRTTPSEPRAAGATGARDQTPKATRRAMDRRAFEQLVADALAAIPHRFRERDDEHRDRRGGRTVARTARRDGDRAAGHAARPLPGHAAHRAPWGHGNTLPDRILLFQGPHERDSEDEDDLVVAIGETLIHEIGHYFGLSEEEIEEIEEKYWNDAVTASATGNRTQAVRAAFSRAGVGRQGRPCDRTGSRPTCSSRSVPAGAP